MLRVDQIDLIQLHNLTDPAEWQTATGPGGASLRIANSAAQVSNPIVITRNKWDANEMELSVGDAVVLGLKGYRLLPHYPLRTESSAKAL